MAWLRQPGEAAGAGAAAIAAGRPDRGCASRGGLGCGSGDDGGGGAGQLSAPVRGQRG